MSHEVIIAALDPEQPPIDPDAWPVSWRHTLPIDHAVQVRLMSDQQGLALAQGVAAQIVVGGSTPDIDGRSYWKRMIPHLAEHVRRAS